MARPSLVFMLVATAISAVILLAGVFLLRVWNPGHNEPREQREGETGEEQVGSLVAIEEIAEPVLVGAAASSSMTAAVGANSAGTPEHQARATAEVGEATTGLHVPRRSHRRILKRPARTVSLGVTGRFSGAS